MVDDFLPRIGVPRRKTCSKPETDNTNLFAFSESFGLETLFDDNKENWPWGLALPRSWPDRIQRHSYKGRVTTDMFMFKTRLQWRSRVNRDLQRFLFTAKRERSRVDRDLEKNKLRLLVQVTPPTTSYASYYKLRLRLAGRRQILLCGCAGFRSQRKETQMPPCLGAW